MNRRNFMKMCGFTLLGVMSLPTKSEFPRTRFYLNVEMYRDFPKDFARKDEHGTEEFLTESFKDNREKIQQYGARWGDEICLGHDTFGHGDVRVSKNWTGDALFIKRPGQRDFYCNDSDLALRDGNIWFVGQGNDS